MAQRFIDEELIKKKPVAKPTPKPVVAPKPPVKPIVRGEQILSEPAPRQVVQPVVQPIIPITQTTPKQSGSTDTKLQELQDSYLRAKAQYEAQQDIALKESAERLAFQKQQITAQQDISLKEANERLAYQKQQNEANRLSLNKQATLSGQENYIANQQANRVLGNQMAQAGLGQTGYRSLAQKKMAENAQKGAQKIGANLSAGIENVNLGEQGQSLDYSQNVRSAQNNYQQNLDNYNLNYMQDTRSAKNAYNQNMANLNLDRNQSQVKYASNGGSQNGGSSGSVNNLDELIFAGNTGRYSREQYKAALNVLGLSATEITAYIKNYDYYAAQRGVQ